MPGARAQGSLSDLPPPHCAECPRAQPGPQVGVSPERAMGFFSGSGGRRQREPIGDRTQGTREGRQLCSVPVLPGACSPCLGLAGSCFSWGFGRPPVHSVLPHPTDSEDLHSPFTALWSSNIPICVLAHDLHLLFPAGVWHREGRVPVRWLLPVASESAWGWAHGSPGGSLTVAHLLPDDPAAPSDSPPRPSAL